MHNWYVLHVKTGAETDIRDYIKRKYPEIKALVPQRKLKERKDGQWKISIRTLFQGYVFAGCNGPMSEDEYYKLSGIGGVIKILRGAADSPIPVPDEEMQFVLRMTQEDDLVGISDLVLDGDKIKVIDGVLKGYEGQIIKVDKRRFRVRVKITLMGQEKIIELGVNVIEKID